jgi:hypothetical protein
MTTERLKSIRVRDFDKGVMLLLATVGMMSNSQMKAVLTAVPDKNSPTGFEGLLSNLGERYGIALNARKCFGGLHSESAAYMKLRTSAQKGLVRTIQQGGTARVQATLAGGGVEVGWALTKLGAAVILALTIRDDLTVDDIRFWASDHDVALTSQIHDIGVSSFLAGLMVGAAYYNNRQTNPIHIDVCQAVGDGHDFVVNGRKFRPDLSCVTFIKSVFVPLFLEWDTGRTSDSSITDKCQRYMRLMLDAPQGSWTAGRPWLVMATPNDTRVRHHEKAIQKAAKSVGLTTAQSYDPMDWCGIAVCSHKDLGQSSPYGAIYRIFDYKTGKLSDDKFTLVSLYRTKVERVTVEEPVAEGTVPVRTVPPEWAQMKKGATTALVGYREDQIEITPASANIGWGHEVA